MRTLPGISNELSQLDEEITTEFLPSITGGIHCTSIERKLLALPAKLSGLRIPIFAENSDQEHEYSLMISKDLSARIMKEETGTQKIKNKIKTYNYKNINPTSLKNNSLNQESAAAVGRYYS